jgi:hypothetical protein
VHSLRFGKHVSITMVKSAGGAAARAYEFPWRDDSIAGELHGKALRPAWKDPMLTLFPISGIGLQCPQGMIPGRAMLPAMRQPARSHSGLG